MTKLTILLLSTFLLSFSLIQTQTEEEKSVNEYNTGGTNKFSSNGEGKSQGLKINIKYPKSWQSIEGEHPHVVRKFVQSDDYVLAVLLVKKQDKEFTQSEINEALTTEGLKSIIPSSGTYVSSNGNLKIESLRSGSVEFTNFAKRMDRDFYSHNLYYKFVYKQYAVFVQFMVINKVGETNESVNNRYKKIQPLFNQMFNSIVVENMWGK